MVDGSGRTGNRKFFAGGDAVNGGASVVEAVRDGSRAARGDRQGAPMSELTEIRWHARAGQGAKTASQMLALALLVRAAASRRSPSTGPSAAGRRFARTRGSPTGRSGVTTRSSIRTSSSSSSRRSCARRA